MTLFNNLGTLESAGLIQVAKVEPDLEYLFRHSLVQDAAYASLLESDRKRLHLAVGNAIENLYPERKRELAAILAYHFREAGDEERALGYFITAGDESLKVYANQEAEYQYRCALQLMCCFGEHTAWLYGGLAEALYRQSRLNESLEALDKGIEVYKSINGWDGVARLYARKARVAWYAYDRPQGLRIALEGLEVVKNSPGSAGKAALMHETARAYYFNGMSDKALPLCRAALSLAEQLGAVNVQADAMATLGILPGVSAEESLNVLRKSVELAEGNGLLQIAVRANLNLGSMMRIWLADNQSPMLYFKRSAELGKLRGVASEEVMGLMSYTSGLVNEVNHKETEGYLARIEELARNISDPTPTLLSVKFMKALLIWNQGDWDTAFANVRDCLDQWIALQNLESQVYCLDELSWLLLEKNRWGELHDLSEAETYLVEAREIIEQDDSNDRMWLYPRFCMLKARQGKLDEARLWFEKSRQWTEARPSAWDDRFELECMVEIYVGEKDWMKALASVEKFNDFERHLGFTGGVVRSLLCWADLLLRSGEPAGLEKAQPLISEALELTGRIGEGYYHQIAIHMLQQVRLKLHAQTLDHAKMTRELKKARLVQESLLPESPPRLAGWELEVVYKPAHETSGDFYDFLPLPTGKTGIVIADVTDKGTSAALFMALGRSLWRTFAVNHPAEPEMTMAETNRRIMADTHGGLFITLFYGILDPTDGTLTYCNAGHLPGLLVHKMDGSLEQLGNTGMTLGALEQADWKRETVVIESGDSLVLYTDGVTDAENESEQFLGQAKLEEVVRTNSGKSATELRDAILAEVDSWVGGSAQFDDLTLMVVVRK